MDLDNSCDWPDMALSEVWIFLPGIAHRFSCVEAIEAVRSLAPSVLLTA